MYDAEIFISVTSDDAAVEDVADDLIIALTEVCFDFGLNVENGHLEYI